MSQRCILCGGSVFQLEIPGSNKTTGNRSFMRCAVCDLIFVPKSFHPLPEDEAARYRLHENTLLNEGYVRMFLEKIALVRQYCPGVRSVLDYGSGHEPVLAELLRRNGFECDIYDPYFFPALPGKTYDLVISTEVFEHFRDIREELSKIRSILDRGGFLAVGTSFHDSTGNFGDWWYASDPTHISFFGNRTFEWIAKRFGFSIIYTDKKNFIILQAGCCH